MEVIEHHDVEEFWRSVAALLAADPIRHTSALTVIARLRRGLPFDDEPPIMITAHDEGTAVGVALCTPPWPLLVSALPVRMTQIVAKYLRDNGIRVPGVTGPTAEAAAFARAWQSTTGEKSTVRMNERLYRLDRLIPPAGIAGQSRLAGDDDVPLLARWSEEFANEALPNAPQTDDYESGIAKAISAGTGFLVWELDGEPVAWASARQPTEGMSRIGPVYTPKAQRGNGYGAAVTAAASRWAIDSGAEHVVLYTDLANRTSNSIYQKIGYRHVIDAVEYGFAPIDR